MHKLLASYLLKIELIVIHFSSIFNMYLFICSDMLLDGECQDVGDGAAQWFSKYLGIECRLYYMSPSHKPRYFTDHSRYGPLGKPDEQVKYCLYTETFHSLLIGL